MQHLVSCTICKSVLVEVASHVWAARCASCATISDRACLECNALFAAPSSEQEFCGRDCVTSAYQRQHTSLEHDKQRQMVLVTPSRTCPGCGGPVEGLTNRKTPKIYCSRKCSLVLARFAATSRPCVHCGVTVSVTSNLRSDFVRCAKHRKLWSKIRAKSKENTKVLKPAENPYDQYLMRGPWWDHKHRAWMVLLMHSGASSKREMEYARYLLSVKGGDRLNDDIPIVYADGDRTNVEISNLALGPGKV